MNGETMGLFLSSVLNPPQQGGPPWTHTFRPDPVAEPEEGDAELPAGIRMVGVRRMQCKDIPDVVFLDAVRRAKATANCGWRTRWEVHVELELAVGPVPENLLLAKARGLIRRQLMGGCACGCRGDWRPAGEDQR